MTQPDPVPPLATYLETIQMAVERGLYRQAMEQVQEALQVYPNSGDLKLWQATTTDALGETAAAIQIARLLTRYPDPDIRKKARYLVQIWEAPPLKRPDDWVIPIPDLTQIPPSDPNERRYVSRGQPTTSQPRSSLAERATENTDPPQNPHASQRILGSLLGLSLLAVLLMLFFVRSF